MEMVKCFFGKIGTCRREEELEVREEELEVSRLEASGPTQLIKGKLMLFLKNKILAVRVDEEHGGNIVSLEYLPNNAEFAHRAGLQAWVKSGKY